MSMDNLQNRYELIAGELKELTLRPMDHVRLAVRLFTKFMGGIQDVRKMTVSTASKATFN